MSETAKQLKQNRITPATASKEYGIAKRSLQRWLSNNLYDGLAVRVNGRWFVDRRKLDEITKGRRIAHLNLATD